jgi:uncharacterized protein
VLWEKPRLQEKAAVRMCAGLRSRRSWARVLRKVQRKRVADRVYHSDTMRPPSLKLFAALIALPLLLFASACASSTHAPEFTPTASTPQPTSDLTSLLGEGQPALRTTLADIAGTDIALEVADDTASRTSGLSRRNGLADDAGMLFVWDGEEVHTLWMKDMRFALDFIWLDEDRTVVHIERDVQPQPGAADSELVRYPTQAPAKYAIELAAGEAARLGVAVGDVVAFDERTTISTVTP